jgi:hypothetical protein
MELVLAALAIGSSPYEPIASREIAFLIVASDASLPGKSTDELVPQFAARYTTEPKLQAEAELCLDRLQRRRFVLEEAGQLFSFAQPFYRAAAEQIFHNPTGRVAALALRTAERGLFCLAAPTLRATARNLDWLHDLLASRPADQGGLIDIAICALKQSLFVATRDLCFDFLVRNLRSLSTERQRELVSWVPAVSTNPDKIEWRDGQACITSSGFRDFSDFAQLYPTIPDRADVATDLSILASKTDDKLSAEKAARALLFLTKFPTEMTPTMAAKLLQL